MSVEMTCDERGCSNEATLICNACIEDKIGIAHDEGRKEGRDEGLASCEETHKT